MAAVKADSAVTLGCCCKKARTNGCRSSIADESTELTEANKA
jgi:hypothetical protein